MLALSDTDGDMNCYNPTKASHVRKLNMHCVRQERIQKFKKRHVKDCSQQPCV